ncbi:MAG: type III pantothenate kinase [Planctomycetes bacterium]|nr:type III pantothenate kinase [Planctomycetota bacterium]
MSGRLLTVDAGNSTLDLMVHPSAARRRFEAHAGDADLLAFVDQHPIEECAAVSVRAGALQRLLPALRARGVRCRVVGEELACPLPLDYATPQTLGADRWLGALAAHRRFGRAVVVDCGTATTVNLVEDDGTFRGGPIAPGLAAFVAGMAAVTPALPAPRLEAEPEMPPRSSQAARAARIIGTEARRLERLVADLLRAARGPATVVVTGGRAELVLRHARLRAESVPDLVHQGLRLLAEASPCGG